MKLLFELITLVLFFTVYQLYGIKPAIVVVIVSYTLITAALLIKHRHVSKGQWIGFILVVVLGGATLLLDNELFFKWKPTVVFWVFATVLLGSQLLLKKNLLQRLGSNHLQVPDQIWARLNIAWIVFSVFMGALNLFVAYQFDTTTWVYFKLFGAVGLLMAFFIIQVICLWRYINPAALEKNGNDDVKS